jgi:hypothetical protein
MHPLPLIMFLLPYEFSGMFLFWITSHIVVVRIGGRGCGGGGGGGGWSWWWRQRR